MAIIKLPIPVDSKYINPAYLPIAQSLKFPSVGSKGYLLGWGRNNANLNLTTFNRNIQKVELTTLNIDACNRTFTFNGTDPSYSVKFKLN